MSNINFESEQVQRASWIEVRNVMLSAMVEAVARARAAVPTDDPREALMRDGMILHQFHIMLADSLGDVEGKILRMSMRTDEDLIATRQRHIEAGRIRGVGVPKT